MPLSDQEEIVRMNGMNGMNENVSFPNGKFGTHNGRVHSVLATMRTVLISWRLESIELVILNRIQSNTSWHPMMN
jgi:hypothetical protein